MQQTDDHKMDWANRLRRMKIDGIFSILLDALGPLTIFFAQFMYVGEPVLSWILPEGQWVEFAHMLESQEDRKTFATYLKEEAWK